VVEVVVVGLFGGRLLGRAWFVGGSSGSRRTWFMFPLMLSSREWFALHAAVEIVSQRIPRDRGTVVFIARCVAGSVGCQAGVANALIRRSRS